MVKIRCACGRTLVLKDEAAGKAFKCPGCGARVQVPEPAPEIPILVSEEDAPCLGTGKPAFTLPASPSSTVEPSHPPAPAAVHRRNLWVAVAFGVVAIFLLVWATRGRDQEPAVRVKSERPIERAAGEDSHLLDENHPDYGGIICLTLVTSAGKKVVQGGGLQQWYDSLTRNERDCVLLNHLWGAVSTGDSERMIREGYGDEIHNLVRILRNDVNTTTSQKLAEDLSKLLPFIRPGSTLEAIYGRDGQSVWQGSDEERRALTASLDSQWEPLGSQIKKDVDHYWYRRWKDEGDGLWK